LIEMNMHMMPTVVPTLTIIIAAQPPAVEGPASSR